MKDKEGDYLIREGLTIPSHEVWFEFSHASGPGGQNVNKVASVATLCFSPASSQALDQDAKIRLAAKLGNRISQDGVLRINCQETRSQATNRALAGVKFRLLLAEALKFTKKRRPTRPGMASRERRLSDKRRRSNLKVERGCRGDMSLSND
ncbi:MAG: aminoacyl-tRNA hydrolase [Planctomycetota bacterium]|nr:aminoacyl-tRNA hydrolase [Planctomycetota bacterium]